MMLPRFLLAVLVNCSCLSALCAAEKPLTEKDLAVFTSVSKAITGDAALILYEGLPHQSLAPNELEKELAEKKTIRIAEFPFYEKPLEVAEADLAALRRLSADQESYWTYGGGKFCGGFHPDYAFAWKEGEQTYYLLICFGCHEMKIISPQAELMVDIRGESYDSFKKTLAGYRQQRPAGK